MSTIWFIFLNNSLCLQWGLHAGTDTSPGIKTTYFPITFNYVFSIQYTGAEDSEGYYSMEVVTPYRWYFNAPYVTNVTTTSFGSELRFSSFWLAIGF